MTTEGRLVRLCGWSRRLVLGALLAGICASSYAADPSKNVVSSTSMKTTPTTVQKRIVVTRGVRKVCYIAIFGSPIPQPCDRIDGPIPTTATPMDVIGRYKIDGK